MITSFSISMPDELKGRLESRADFEGRDRSNMVQWMIKEYLKDQPKPKCMSYGCSENAIKDRPYCYECAIVGSEE